MHQLTFVIATGGTAGHVVPSLAIADELRASGHTVHFIGADRAEAELVLGQLQATVRRNYSSPAIHAAGIVSRVLGDPALRAKWEADVAAMRERILAMRRQLHGVLSARRPERDFGYFLTQRGMFSYTGLSAAQVDRLREEFGVYLVRSGRMCVAGLNSGNVERTAQAMAAVL